MPKVRTLLELFFFTRGLFFDPVSNIKWNYDVDYSSKTNPNHNTQSLTRSANIDIYFSPFDTVLVMVSDLIPMKDSIIRNRK